MNYQVITMEQHLVPVLLDQGRREVQWQEGLTVIASYLRHPEHLDLHLFTNLVELFIWAWPESLIQRLPTYWTDLAWRRIARLGIVQRKCPDCGQAGAQGQMALYGAIYACDLCEGVQWGSAVY